MENKTTRTLTICSTFEKESSSVLLKGKWFQKSGFKPGDLIELNIIEKGKIIITNKGSKFSK